MMVKGFMLVKDREEYCRKDGKTGRFYYKKDSDIPYPSVTTVIGQAKSQKFASSSPGPSAHIGTLVHYHILKNYTRELLSLPTNAVYNVPRDEVRGRMARCIKMWKDLELDIKPIAVETALFWDDPYYAGTLDLYGYVNDELYVLDIKTGLSYEPDHSRQAAAYWNAIGREPNVMFVYLDGIVDRNPEQVATIKRYDKKELETAYDDFLDCYVDFRF